MGKMNELSQMIDNLITAGEILTETGKALRAFYSAPDQEEAKPEIPEKEEPKTKTAPEKKEASVKAAPAATPEPKVWTREEIRGMLAAKANEADGKYKPQVKAIVRKYGNGGSLKDIPEENYPDVAAELEGLADA